MILNLEDKTCQSVLVGQQLKIIIPPFTMADSGFKSRDMGLRTQKKILSRMATKSIAKAFIDDTTGQLLDDLHSMARHLSGHKKDADKVIKNIIKIVIKIGILSRNDQFTNDELILAEKFKRKFHSLAMTIISFFEVDFSYDRNFLNQSLNECCAMLKQLVGNHLTDKSLSRIDHVFSFFSDPEHLDMVFKKEGEHRASLGRIVEDMHKLMDEGGL
ncbi:hypothetical protein CHUAL_000408 [Chamberlinius hualienensis]